MKRSLGITFFLAVALLMIPIHTYANSTFDNREQVLDFLREAFQAQVKLSEKERGFTEIEEILSPYFSESYQKLFLKENLVEIDGQFITFGSDFAPYYIPFFQFSDRTQVVSHLQKIYVFEYFPGNVEGPVSYESHYEGILIEQFAGEWKVSEYLYDNIPEDVLSKKPLGKAREKHIKSVNLRLPYFVFSRGTDNNPLDLLSRSLFIIGQKEGDFRISTLY